MYGSSLSPLLVELIRAVVREELSLRHLGEIAVVTAVAPHSRGSDTHNHECSVRLRESGLELTHVPIATPHIGLVSAPRVGDLVLLTYIHGDPSRPVVTGRLHSDEARPPLHGTHDLHLAAPYRGKTSINIGADQAVTITAGGTDIVLEQDGSVYVNSADALGLFIRNDVILTCENATIEASGNIELGEKGAGVITEASHRCYFTGAALVGSRTVKAKG